MEKSIGIIIVAGGSGRRMGGNIPKQFAILGQQPVLAHTINAFHEALPGQPIVVVLPEQQIAFWQDLCSRFRVARHKTVAGGAERFHSVKNGIEALSGAVDLIAVHDGVRPLVSRDLILRCVECASVHGSAIPVVNPVDSLRIVSSDGKSTPVDRSSIRCVQTPQVFEASTLRAAYDREFSEEFTDDASVVESMGLGVELCMGERNNLKITTPEDMTLAYAILDAQEQALRGEKNGKE